MKNTDYVDTDIILTEEERAAFRRQIACKSACEELIKRVVKEWEDASMVDSVLWRLVEEKYNLNFENFDYQICNLTGRLKKRHKAQTAMQELSEKFEKQDKVKSYFKRVFGMEK
jgi:hypothetical protein